MGNPIYEGMDRKVAKLHVRTAVWPLSLVYFDAAAPPRRRS